MNGLCNPFLSCIYTHDTAPKFQMSQSRPQIPKNPSSSNLLPYASLQSPESYFKEPRGRSSRPRLFERGSDNLAPKSPSRSRSPKSRVSFDSVERSSKRSSAATEDVLDEASEQSSPDPQSFNNDPPRPAKPGYEWVWYPDPYGYWAERPEIHRTTVATVSRTWPKWKRISFTSKASTSSIDKLMLSNLSNETHQTFDTRRVSDAERRDSLKSVHQNTESRRNSRRVSDTILSNTPAASSVPLQEKFMKSISFLSPIVNPPAGEGEGFFKSKLGKAKKVTEHVERKPSIPEAEPKVLSKTALVLKGVAEFLEHAERQGSDSGKLLADPHHIHQRKGLFSRHRRNSHDSVLSLTDSVMDILRGKTPVVTPNPEPKYAASDGNMYTRVIIGSKDAPTYLPSEATRIHTPPLSEDHTPGRSSRDFFFDLSPPSNDETKAPTDFLSTMKQAVSPSPSRKSPSMGNLRNSNKIAKLRDMWEHEAAKRGPRPARFELDVPEHYPNSPLCPRNPKHKSGGTGICVYHGRNVNRKQSADVNSSSLKGVVEGVVG